MSKKLIIGTREWNELVDAVVAATIDQDLPTLDPLLKVVVYDVPSRERSEALGAETVRYLLMDIGRTLEKALGSMNHPTIAWFMVYVGLSASPPEAIGAVQIVLEKGFIPFRDFFVDRQGIHFYEQGALSKKGIEIPERLSEFTKMTVTMNSAEVDKAMERYKLSEAQARKVLLNLKIMEQKMNIPLDNLFVMLDGNDELLQNVLYADLTGEDDDGKLGL